MIVSRAPVRFSLGGGGTDLPSYSRVHGGFVVAAAVDKFVNVCVARRFRCGAARSREPEALAGVRGA